MSVLFSSRNLGWNTVSTLLKNAPAGRGILVIDSSLYFERNQLMHDMVRTGCAAGFAVVSVPTRVDDLFGSSPHIDRTLDMLLTKRIDPSTPLLIAMDAFYVDPSAVVHLLSSLQERVTRQSTAALLTVNSTTSDAEPLHVPKMNHDVVDYFQLHCIDNDAVVEMVTQSLGATPEASLLTLLADANGSPFLITELLAGLREERRLELRDGLVFLRGLDSLPQRVKTIVHSRINMLSAKTRQLLRVAAATGESFLLNDVSTMMSETPAALLPAVDEALLSGVLVCDQKKLVFSCRIVWRALVESVPKPVLFALSYDGVDKEPNPSKARAAASAPDDEPAQAANGRAQRAIALTGNTPTRPTSPRMATRKRWRNLTDQEHDIARLVITGLTNRQVAKRLFLSSHTVNYHLRKIFQKLEIRSRVELAHYFHNHSMDDSTSADTT